MQGLQMPACWSQLALTPSQGGSRHTKDKDEFRKQPMFDSEWHISTWHRERERGGPSMQLPPGGTALFSSKHLATQGAPEHHLIPTA